MPDPKIDKYERMLSAIPMEFRELATWGWTELRPTIAAHAQRYGATPAEAAIIGSRLARLVVGQVYQDITIRRAAKAPTT